MNEILRRQKLDMDRAQALLEAGKFLEAERACEAANDATERTDGRIEPGIAHLLGRIYMAQGRYPAALGAMAPNVQRDIPLQRLDLALCYLRVGDEAHARALYDPEAPFARTNALEPRRTWAPDVRSPQGLEGALLWSKGIALSDVTRVEEARACYEQASQRLPKNPVLALNLAVEARNLRRYKRPPRRSAWCRPSATRGCGRSSATRRRRWRAPPRARRRRVVRPTQDKRYPQASPATP